MGAVDRHTPVELTLVVKGRFGIRERYGLRVNLSSNDVQRVHLRSKRPPARISPQDLEKKLKDSLESKPGIVLRLDVINKCNLRCVMCHFADVNILREPTWKLTVEEFEDFFEDVSPYVRSVLLSCADEPLTSHLFPTILSHVAEKYPHLEIEFCTNAMLMNARIRRLVIEKGVTHLIFSMDGVRKKTLESIRIGSKYEKVVGNILALRDLKQAASSEFPIFVMDFVMMASNIHEAPAFVELSSRLGARMIDFRHVVPGELFNDPKHFLCNDRAKYNYFRDLVVKEGKRHKVDIVIPPPYETTERFSPTGVPHVDLGDFEKVDPSPVVGKTPVPREFPKGFKTRHTRGTAAERFAETYCERPFSEMTILDQDLVKPCPWHRTHLGKLSDGKTLAEIFFGNEFAELRKKMLDPAGDPNCQDCPWKSDLLMSEVAQYGGGYRRWRKRILRALARTAALLRLK
ncbi:MAG: radical SAM protein [bacterium]|nr:radical SAM protein [bacterium]